MQHSPSSKADKFSQLVKKFPAFYGTRRFFTVLTSARHMTPSWDNSIQSPRPYPTSWTSIKYYPPIYAWISPTACFPQVSPSCIITFFYSYFIGVTFHFLSRKRHRHYVCISCHKGILHRCPILRYSMQFQLPHKTKPLHTHHTYTPVPTNSNYPPPSSPLPIKITRYITRYYSVTWLATDFARHIVRCCGNAMLQLMASELNRCIVLFLF
jgi:hypothetical protein